MGSTVDFAALLWCTASNPDPTTILNTTTITFGLPDGTTVPVTPDLSYSSSGLNNLKNFSVTGREVTNIVKALPNSGFGDYSVSGVYGDFSNFGIGWSLVLAYKNPAMPLRNVSIYTGFLTNGITTTISGFYTPMTGTVKARVYVMSQYGFSVLVGDTFTLNSTNLFGPRNPATNFFPAQICDYKGNLLLTSSFGDRNSTPGSAPARANGDRVDIDITNVSGDGAIPNGQRSATVVIGGTGDPLSTNAIGLEVNANSPLMNIVKVVNPTLASVGDTVTYTMTIANTGSTTATNVFFVDTIPLKTTFVNNSVTVNGSAAPSGTNPQTGFSLGSIGVSGISTVTFNVKLDSSGLLGGQTIPNTSFIGYDFISDPSLPAFTGSSTSNVAIVTVTVPKMSISKQVNSNFATSNDILQYTFVLNNLSNPSTASNITLLDTIPSGVTFVPGSVLINGSPSTGSPVPPTGLSVSNVAGSSITTVTFNVTVNTIPNVNAVTNNGFMNATQDGTTFTTISNSVVTTITYISLSSSKTVSKNFANIGDVLTYTIPITNSGNTTASNILFIDTIPNGTSLVSGSFKQDSTSVSGTPNNTTTLPNSIIPQGTSTITFQVTVTTIPVPNPIPNTAFSTVSFTIDGTATPNRTGSSSTNSNTVNTQINNANLGGITKVVDKSFAICGEVITYTITIPNSGNTTATNVILKDTIPNGSSLVGNTVTVNGVVQPVGTNPQTGISLGTINPGRTATVTFQVIVNC